MFCGLRSMLRGPEGKMMLLTPLFMLGFFAIMIFWRSNRSVPQQAVSFVGLGAIGIVLLSFVQVLCNQFGYDRGGFRALLLSPSPRRHILLGKNLSFAPFALGTGAVALIIIQLSLSLPLTHLLATALQLPVAYLLFCLMGNVVSMLAPAVMVRGAIRPGKSRLVTVFTHLLATFLSPLTILPAGLFLGLEVLFHNFTGLNGIPIYLPATLVELPLVIWIYWKVLPWQGALLQKRQQAVLEAVVARSE
jgi:hypothetical protein